MKDGKHMRIAVCLIGALVVSAEVPAASNAVVPIEWTDFTAGNPTDTDSVLIKNILRNANEYALNTWYNTVKDYDSQGGDYLSFGGTGEAQIRPPAGEAYSLAVAIATGAYDATHTGVTLNDAKTKTLRLIASVAYRHQANTGGGWGNAWQSALWAAYAGTAGWLLWEDLSSTDREYVRKMVEFEANRFNYITPPVYRNTAGTIVSSGDSKGEENAWNATILQLAVAMMPNHTNALVWAEKCIEYMVSGYSRPSDLTNTTMLNGRRVSDWLVYGTNIETDGTMINHSIIHPDYTATVASNLAAALVFTLAQQPTPSAAIFNADIIYDSLVDLVFTYPPYYSPGGTCYIEDSEAIYYPQGNDWGSARRMHFAGFDALTRFHGTDSLVSLTADYWEPLHAQKVLDMQDRFTDGHTYLDNSEDDYSGREEWVAYLVGRAYLTKWVANQDTFVLSNDVYAFPFLDDFADGDAEEWVESSGTWNVVSGEYSQTSTSGTSLSLIGAPLWADYAIQATIENVASGNGSIGLAGRIQDSANNYFLAYDRAGANFKLYKKVSNVNTQLGSTHSASWTSGTTKAVRLSFSGTSLRVDVDGSNVITATDSTYVKGPAALRSYNNAATFDDVSVEWPALPFEDDFDDGDDDGWAQLSGTWSVASGEYNQSATSGGVAQSLIGLSSWADYTFEVRIESAASGTGSMGVVGRFQDASNYYFVAYDRAAGDFKLYKKVSGTNTQLGSTYTSAWTTGTSKTVRLIFSGTSLTVNVDGTNVITATDATYASGPAGPRTYNNAATFDDVAIY